MVKLHKSKDVSIWRTFKVGNYQNRQSGNDQNRQDKCKPCYNAYMRLYGLEYALKRLKPIFYTIGY